MKQKVASSIGGCLLVVFLLLACPIRGRAAGVVNLIDNDNGIQVQYQLTPMEREGGSTETVYSAWVIGTGIEDLHIKSAVSDDQGTYKIKEIKMISARQARKIKIEEGITSIKRRALYQNTSIEEVSIPASVKNIDVQVFSGCSKLSKVNFAENSQLEDIAWQAFYDCSALTSIEIPDSVIRIGTEAFSGCTSLEKVDISEKSQLTSVEYGAFGYYPYERKFEDLDYRGVTVGSGTTSRSNTGVKIKEIYLPAAAIHTYSYYDWGSETYQNVEAAGIFAGCKTLQKVTIGDSNGVKADLPMEMFAGCTELTDVNMNGNVKSIGNATFADCNNLESIDLTETEVAGEFSFTRTGIKEVTIPSSVKKLGAFSFALCTKLDTMNLQSSLPEQDSSIYLKQILGGEWFISPSSATSYSSNAKVRELQPKRTALRVLNVSADSSGKTAFDGRQEFAGALYALEEVTLPEGMTEIPKVAFHLCYSLKKVKFPTSIQKIGTEAFQFDINLDVDFSRLTNLKTIEARAFMLLWNKHQAGIQNIILPESLESIGNSAFYGQEKATKVIIPKSVTYIGVGTFQRLPSLKNLEIYGKNIKVINTEYGGTRELFDSGGFNRVFWNVKGDEDPEKERPGTPATMTKIVLGKDTLESGKIEQSLFYNSFLEEADIQMDNIQNIGNAMFLDSKNLKSFIIPKTVKTIDQAAFGGTSSLKEITIPKNVTTMDVEVFRQSGLEKIYILNKDLTIKEPTTDEVSEAESASKTKVTLKTGENEKVEDYFAIPKNVVIYGLAGSTAEVYAKNHGNKFVEIYLQNKVTFDSMGGSSVRQQTIEFGEKLSRPEDPAKAGYVFRGWYTDKECTKAFDFDKNVIRQELTLYAKWDKQETSSTPFSPKKNARITSGKNTYKITKVTKSKTGTVEFTGVAKGKNASTVTIPNTIKINGKKFKVTSIASKAFANNKKVKKVIIGNNVKTIKKKAFYNARNLKKITIEANVTTIGSQAFGNLPKLEKIVVKSRKLKKVHKKAFYPLKRKRVIRIYKKVNAADSSNTKKTTKKTSEASKRQIIIKVPKSKKTVYEKLLIR